ncbi:hypothetical protein MM2B0307_1196 [Mycobacteroides abscessus subsp. bolletii 2B-0307]|nr:hypothetical protein MM2B0307_1196 [Mycobacteroides abscessus subsp. bolletii 2B-0307]
MRRGDHDHRGQPLLHVVRRCEKVIRHGSSWTLGRFDGRPPVFTKMPLMSISRHYWPSG